MPAQYLESAARATFHASWQAAILAVIVLAICRAFPQLPAAARSWLWLIVLLRLVVPLTPQSSWSLFNLANVSRTIVSGVSLASDVAGNRSAAASAQMVHGADDRGIATPTSANVTSSPGTLANESATDQGSAGASSIVPTLMRGAVFIWALGLVALLARGLRSWISLRRLLRAGRVVEEEWPLAVLEECRLEAGIGRFVELVVTERKVAPALAGVVFPRIVLSEETLAAISPAELAWLFRHELAHVRRWDLAGQRLWSFASALHWFNPLVWLAASRARIEAELACDESVIKRSTRRQQLAYGQTLLKVAGLLTESKHLPAAVGLLLRAPALPQRVRAIAAYRRPSRAARLFMAIMLLGFAGSGLTDAIDSLASQPASTARNPDKRIAGLPIGPDGRPQLAAVLDAWDRGRQRLKSYDLYLKSDIKTLGNMGQEGWPPLPKPSFGHRSSHEMRADVKLRVEDGVETLGQKPSGNVSVWDGELAKQYVADSKQFQIAPDPGHFPAGYELSFSGCANGRDMIKVLRKRSETIIEQADDDHIVVFTPARLPFGYRIWLDPKKNFLPIKIDRLLEVDGTIVVDLEQVSTLEEILPRVWAPLKFVESFHPQTKESATRERRLVLEAVTTVNRERSRFNVPIDESLFQLEVPIGTTVYDTICHTSYEFGKANTALTQISQWAIEGKVSGRDLKAFAKKSGIANMPVGQIILR